MKPETVEKIIKDFETPLYVFDIADAILSIEIISKQRFLLNSSKEVISKKFILLQTGKAYFT